MIFKVFSMYKNVRDGASDPVGFGVDTAVGPALAFMVVSIIIGVGVTVLLGLIGYGVIGDSSLIARVFFWILAVIHVPLLAILIAMVALSRKLKSYIRRATGADDVETIIVDDEAESESQKYLHK